MACRKAKFELRARRKFSLITPGITGNRTSSHIFFVINSTSHYYADLSCDGAKTNNTRKKMTKSDLLLAFTNQILKERFEKLKINELEQMGYKVSVYDIFERNFELEATYYELLDYLEEHDQTRSLVPKVEMYYQNIFNK